METQQLLSDYDLDSEQWDSVALVGCGSSKKDGLHEAADLYTSPYFTAKAQFAAELRDDWQIMSAKHGLIAPDTAVSSYDTEITDVNVDRWLGDISAPLTEYLEDTEQAWVLIGESYLTAEDSRGRTVEHSINAASDGLVYYPFRQTAGIGEPQRWLNRCTKKRKSVMPYDLWEHGQRSLDAY